MAEADHKQNVKIKLFGMWNKYNANCEVSREAAWVFVERPFSSKSFTMTVEQARELANALLVACGDRPQE